jgi:hypothetical protein
MTFTWVKDQETRGARVKERRRDPMAGRRLDRSSAASDVSRRPLDSRYRIARIDRITAERLIFAGDLGRRAAFVRILIRRSRLFTERLIFVSGRVRVFAEDFAETTSHFILLILL